VIFTYKILTALEAELRSLRKGAVELEEQNAVLSSHITELTDVVKELRNAKAIMQVYKVENEFFSSIRAQWNYDPSCD
jgi:prefoldin subunit 5